MFYSSNMDLKKQQYSNFDFMVSLRHEVCYYIMNYIIYLMHCMDLHIVQSEFFNVGPAM